MRRFSPRTEQFWNSFPQASDACTSQELGACLYLTPRGVSADDCMLCTGQGCDIRVDCKTKEEQFRWAKASYRTVCSAMSLTGYCV